MRLEEHLAGLGRLDQAFGRPLGEAGLRMGARVAIGPAVEVALRDRG